MFSRCQVCMRVVQVSSVTCCNARLGDVAQCTLLVEILCVGPAFVVLCEYVY